MKRIFLTLAPNVLFIKERRTKHKALWYMIHPDSQFSMFKVHTSFEVLLLIKKIKNKASHWVRSNIFGAMMQSLCTINIFKPLAKKTKKKVCKKQESAPGRTWI